MYLVVESMRDLDDLVDGSFAGVRRVHNIIS